MSATTTTAITQPTSSTRPATNISQRRISLIAGVGLLVVALLSPFALFGVLQALVVPQDATATFNNIIASEGLFRSGIAAFLIVIMLDVVVAWGLYVLLEPLNRRLALLTAWLRVAYAVVFASVLVNLLDAAELVAGAGQSALSPEQLHAQVMSSIASFEGGWVAISLAIFGLHLAGLGYLLFRSVNFPRFLGVLVVVAGGGYLFDSFGTILVADYALTVGTFTFVGEALLIFWLFWRAAKGFRPESGSSHGSITEPRTLQPSSVSS